MATVECKRCGRKFEGKRHSADSTLLCMDCVSAIRHQASQRFMHVTMIGVAFIWIALLLFIEWRKTESIAPFPLDAPREELPTPAPEPGDDQPLRESPQRHSPQPPVPSPRSVMSAEF